MTDDVAELTATLDALVRTIPGVSALYSSAPAIVTTVRQIAAGGDSPSLVSVRSTDDGYDIVANIGVASEQQGPQTAAAVSSAILDAVAPALVSGVHVRISRIVD